MNSGGDARFAHLLLRVLDDSRRVGTHKLVLLLALLRATERATAEGDGTPPLTLPVSLVADELVEVMWHQTGTYTPDPTTGAVVLHHGTNPTKPSLLATAVDTAKRTAATWTDTKTRHHDTVADTIKTVSDALVNNPIPRLQRVGGDTVEFIYSWPHTNSTAAAAAKDQPLNPSNTDPRLTFKPDAAALLLRYGQVLRPLIESHLVAAVADYSGLATNRNNLHTRLFPDHRTNFPAEVNEALYDLQDGRCLYCPDSSPLPSPDAGQVDHFIPWSRFPNDAFENLVLAHGSCNGSKNAELVSARHIERWTGHATDRHHLAEQLEAAGHATSDPARTAGLFTTAYDLLDIGFPVWDRRGHTIPFDDEQHTVYAQAADHLRTIR